MRRDQRGYREKPPEAPAPRPIIRATTGRIRARRPTPAESAARARSAWLRARLKLGKGAEDLCVMHKHPVYPHGPDLITVLERRGQRFRRVLEIGTANGGSAAILAHFCDHVHTIDIKEMPLAERVIAEMGQARKVTRHIVKDNTEKAVVVGLLSFDMAFIDGDHHANQFLIDFNLTKKCGLLLCHDYPTWRPNAAGPGVVLDAQTEGDLVGIDPPFVWWEAESHGK